MPPLPWTALLWLLPFAPRGIAITRLGWRRLKAQPADRSNRAEAPTLKSCNLETLKRSEPWNA